MNINIIVAYCKNRGIGINNKLPWNYPEDLKQFAKITKGNGNNAVIMGRKTYESIGRQLPRRYNIILSRNKIFNGSATQTVKSLENAIEICKERNFDEVFIIGGQSVYEEALNKKLVHKIYATEIDKEYKCDTFFPELNIYGAKVASLQKVYSESTQTILFYKIYDLIDELILPSRSSSICSA